MAHFKHTGFLFFRVICKALFSQKLFSIFSTQSKKTQDTPANAGFTLIETLIAIMLMGISLVSIMALFSGGLRSSSRIRDYSNALILAESQLDENLAEGMTSSADVDSGSSDIFTWRRESEPYYLPDEIDTGADPAHSRIKISVNWMEGDTNKSVTLFSIAPIPKEEEDVSAPES